MFNGLVNIVKRRKNLHCGSRVRMGGSIKIVSVCNCTWMLTDEIYEADSKEVTCKKCLKLLAKADEKGRVEL
jgi:hypothetical protein